MSADEILDAFDLDGLREFRAGVVRLRDAALTAQALDRATSYTKVIAELDRRIASKEAA